MTRISADDPNAVQTVPAEIRGMLDYCKHCPMPDRLDLYTPARTGVEAGQSVAYYRCDNSHEWRRGYGKVGERAKPKRIPHARPTRPRSEVSTADRTSVLGAGVCRYCGDILGPFEVDHVRPLSRGGTNDIDNLACCCVACNTQKRAMLLHEWMQWRSANGMSWPPVASHATDPRHFMDFCEQCRDALYESTPDDVHIDPALYVFAPYRLSPDGAGYHCYYHCPKGHRPWTCWYYTIKHYYSDCSCSFCVMCRMEAEA